MKGSKDAVVEHKGNVRHAPARMRIFVRSFSGFDWRTESWVSPTFVRQGI
jgi:hypothetical protein